jgi:copper resistance protein C
MRRIERNSGVGGRTAAVCAAVLRRGRAVAAGGMMLAACATPESASAHVNPSERDARLLPSSGLPTLALPMVSRHERKAPDRLLQLAHAIVVRTSPAQSGVAAADIGKVEVWYDAGIRDAFAALAVVSASGERVDKRDAAIDAADATHVSVSVNSLAPGKYTARYRALSADGHLVSGSWEFDVQP